MSLGTLTIDNEKRLYCSKCKGYSIKLFIKGAFEGALNMNLSTEDNDDIYSSEIEYHEDHPDKYKVIQVNCNDCDEEINNPLINGEIKECVDTGW